MAHRPNVPVDSSPDQTMALLRAVAARADGEWIAVLRSDEEAFAMTLAGRRLLERIHLDGPAFRLSSRARELLTQAALNTVPESGVPDHRPHG